MNRELLAWLGESEDPSLRYRTLRELRDRDDRDPEVLACRAEIPVSPVVRKLLAFAELPELYGHTLVNADMQRPSFPLSWRG